MPAAAVEGVLEGASTAAVAELLSGRGLTPVDIRETRRRRRARPLTGAACSSRRSNTSTCCSFSRQMHTLLKAGVPIMRALAGLQDSATNPAMKDVIRAMREAWRRPRAVGGAGAAPGGVRRSMSMVRVGETTGRLEDVLPAPVRSPRVRAFMREQVKSALRYPMFVVIAMAIAIVIINIFVIPAFAKVFKGFGAELPLMTRILIGFSDFMVPGGRPCWPD
jgi:MSHA biogenesis protein MshG